VRLTRKLFLVVVLSAAGVLVIALIYAGRSSELNQSSAPASSTTRPPATAAYADASACASCHEEIARTYSLTGMARGFSVAQGSVAQGSVAQGFSPAIGTPLFHKASNRYYTMVERDGKFYQRRHQIGFDGKETNVLELEAHYVIGSGNHARTFLHRKADGRLVQLPVSWYSGTGQGGRGEGQGHWQMSPGYDKAAHLDFRRVIDAGCMSCHNGYPRTPVKDDLEGPRFTGPLPEGIDCQRCHGPGRAHIDAINARDLDAARRAIVNPAKLDRERQLETCMQCHLESTSSPLPFQVRRAEQPPFSYVPGKPLGDYFIHFDHAAGTGHDDKFEIAGSAYRLRKSACFQRSEMTCGTCHDPHDIPRGAAAVQHYVAVCQSCHSEPHATKPGMKAPGMKAGGTCIDCHMPKRRAEDAVHVVMTDHYIQRRRPPRDLLADRTEAQNAKRGEYRGEVALYYPARLPESADNELYLALAQVQEGSNLSAGIRRLQQAIETHRPSRAEVYYRLARAYSRIGDLEADIRWCREALRRDAAFVPALKELADAATKQGDFAEASQALEKAVSLHPDDATALADLGNVYLQQGRADDAERALRRALEADPTLPPANNTMGLAMLRKGRADAAETYFREAIRMQPDLAEAHNNVGNLLASRRAYAEAGFHFAQAIASDPNYVEAHHSYGLVLALTKAYPSAVAELETAIRLAPALLPARLDLAEVLVSMGRRAEARAHFEAAARSADTEVREAALAGLRAVAP
jgi:tetratricopeptide (TPR) repeat protein